MCALASDGEWRLRGPGPWRKGCPEGSGPCRPAVRVPFWYNEGIQGLGWLNLVSSLQSTNDSVLAVASTRDSSSIATSGKSHVHFWNWNGGTGVPGNGMLTRKQGVFGGEAWMGAGCGEGRVCR